MTDVQFEGLKKQLADCIWLRWVLMIPWAFAWSFIINFPLHWILMMWFSTSCNQGRSFSLSQQNIDAIERFVLPAFSSYGFVVGGARMAPKYNFIAGCVHAFGYACGAFYLLGVVGFELRVCILWLVGIGVGLMRASLMQTDWQVPLSSKPSEQPQGSEDSPTDVDRNSSGLVELGSKRCQSCNALMSPAMFRCPRCDEPRF